METVTAPTFAPAASFGKPQVLVVEDDPHIARLLSANLRKAGLGCHVESSGKVAMQTFERMQPHLVLLDLMLPDATGYEVCARIRQSSATPIIMLTARSEARDQMHGFKVGADDYVTKPFDVSLLMARVAAQLRRVYRYGVAADAQTQTTGAQRPANWLECDGCRYMGPRDKFEDINDQGFVQFNCPNCGGRIIGADA